MKGTWQTTGSSGGPGTAAAVIVAALVIAAIAGPVLAAVAELLRAVLIAAAVILGLAAAAGAALVAWRLRRGRQNTPLVVHQVPSTAQQAAESLPAARRPAIGAPAEVHLHLHGVSAEDLAAILAQQTLPSTPAAERAPGPGLLPNHPGPGCSLSGPGPAQPAAPAYSTRPSPAGPDDESDREGKR